MTSIDTHKERLFIAVCIRVAKFYSYFLDYTYKKSVQGAYAMFWENNIPVDWVSNHDIEKIMKYKLVYYPAPLIMDHRTAEILKNYVKKGGFLVSESSVGLRSENTWLSPVVPSCGLVALFGCKEKNRSFISEPLTLTVPAYDLELSIANMVSYFDPVTARVIGFWEKEQKPAITINKYGKGNAMLLGMHLGLSYRFTKDCNIVKFIKLIIDEAKIDQQVCLKGTTGMVRSKSMRSETKRLLFLFNYGNCSQRIEFSRPMLVNPIDLLGNVRFKEGSNNALSIPPHEVCCILTEMS